MNFQNIVVLFVILNINLQIFQGPKGAVEIKLIQKERGIFKGVIIVPIRFLKKVRFQNIVESISDNYF